MEEYTLEDIVLLKEENERLKSEIQYLELMLAEKNSRGAGRKNISLDTQKEIIQKSKEGIKVKELSNIYRLSTATIYSILKKEQAIYSQPEEPVPSFEFIEEVSTPTDGKENIFTYLNEGFFS